MTLAHVARCSVAAAPCESLIAHHVETRRTLQIRQLCCLICFNVGFSFPKKFFETFWVFNFSISKIKSRRRLLACSDFSFDKKKTEQAFACSVFVSVLEHRFSCRQAASSCSSTGCCSLSSGCSSSTTSVISAVLLPSSPLILTVKVFPAEFLTL